MLAAALAARRVLRPRTRLPLLVAWLAVVAACGDPAGPGDSSRRGATDSLTALPRALSDAERATVSAGNGFTFALLREVNARKAGQNVFISPLSASMALGMTANGAAGETETAMRTALGFGGQTEQQVNEGYRGLRQLLLDLDPSVTIGVANSIWYRTELPVLPSFLDVSRAYFDAEVTAASFDDPATLGRVNDWAKAKTNGAIPRVLERMPDDVVMLLMNALYFKGSWRTQFDPSQTRQGPFTRDDGQVLSVPMMSRENTPLRLGFLDGVTVGELPYGNGAYVMTILLPGPRTSVDAFVATLDEARWRELLAAMHDVKAAVVLPKFRLKYDDEYSDVLAHMGMADALCDYGSADFTRLAPSPLGYALCISMVKQSAFVDVNEEGTEAAAVTTVGIGVVSLPPSLRVDRPFVFAIRERFSGAVLFVGKVAEPTS